MVKTCIFMILVLGSAIPARATFSYYNGTSGNTQYNNAVLAAGLTPLGPYSFGGVYGTLLAGNTEYQDTATGVEFFNFKNNGTTADSFTIPVNTLQQHVGGDLIEIVLPVNVYSFGATFTFTAASFANVCFDAGVSAFDSGCSGNQNPFWTSGSEFIGVTSDTPFNTIWIGPISLNPILSITNFQIGQGASLAETPEARSMALLGAGLLLLGMLKRRRVEPCAQS